MYSAGIDIVDIKRIEKSTSNNRFLNRVFSKKELDFFSSKKNPYPSMAGNWAAKEAFSKAIGTGVKGFSLNEVSILRYDNGKPYIELSGKAKDITKGLLFSVSISHTDTLATAIVISFQNEDQHKKFLHYWVFSTEINVSNQSYPE